MAYPSGSWPILRVSMDFTALFTEILQRILFPIDDDKEVWFMRLISPSTAPITRSDCPTINTFSHRDWSLSLTLPLQGVVIAVFTIVLSARQILPAASVLVLVWSSSVMLSTLNTSLFPFASPAWTRVSCVNTLSYVLIASGFPTSRQPRIYDVLVNLLPWLTSSISLIKGKMRSFFEKCAGE
jgi:hypothetical protein